MACRDSTHAWAAVTPKWLSRRLNPACGSHQFEFGDWKGKWYEPATKEQPKTRRILDRMEPSIYRNINILKR